MKTGYADTRHGRVHYREAGTGAPLLLLHATPKSSRSYKALVPHLTDHHRVIAPDTLGFGESDPLPDRVSIPMLAESMSDLIDALNAAPAVVFGLHTGNKIGAALTAEHTDKVSRFILCGMTHSIILDQEEREVAIKALVRKPFTRTDISEDEKKDRDQGAASIDAMYEANYGFDLAAVLSTLTVPMLVLELVTPEEVHLGAHADAVVAQTQYGQGTTFDGSDRDALDKHPELLAEIVLKFSNQL